MPAPAPACNGWASRRRDPDDMTPRELAERADLAVYEAAAAASTPGETADAQSRAVEAARADFILRAQRVEALRRSPGWAHRLTLGALNISFPRSGANSGARLILVLACVFVGAAAAGPYVLMLIVLIALPLVLVCFAAATQASVASRTLTMWARRTCPSCQYDLSSLPSALPGIEANDRGTGPAVCPECGLRWPLVPRV